jgi:uncharacterized protein (DUF58 family)
MFGEVWLALITVLMLASIFMRHGTLFVVSAILLLAAMVSRLWDRYCLEKVEYRRQFSQRRAFFGEQVDLTLEIVNRKLLPLAWVEIEDEFPDRLSPAKGRVTSSYKPNRNVLSNMLSLRWFERVRRHYRVACDARGYHTFGPAKMRSGDIFGFGGKEVEVPEEDHLLVYPRVVPISRLGLPSKDPFGDITTRHWIFEDPLRTVGVRDYAYGDNPRRIHWKATARTHNLQVKVYEPTTTYRLMIFLNLNTSGAFWWWQGYDSDLLELAISTGASVANWAIEQGYQVGICVNGNTGANDKKVKLAASRDPDQLTHILEALARVTPFATMPLEELLQSESRGLPYGATIVVVTAVMNDDILAELWAQRAPRKNKTQFKI